METGNDSLHRWKILLLLPALLLVVLAAYRPVWHGGMLWDDDNHITRSDLRATEGLWRIWFEIGATQQYYPLVHSAFWIEHRLWGDDTLGYHLINIVLHALAAFLAALILRRLAVPGACLAALIFALHPVHVESVAWISELKNTLSGCLFLSAALAYVHFDRSRGKRPYALSLILFGMALVSKTVAATLPGALLAVFWWRRGRLHWRRDVLPLAPFFAVGAAAGLFTAWFEHDRIGARGAEFGLTIIQRCLVCSRAIWFYLGKLAWPAHLTFTYPRWVVDQKAAWQYLYPAALLALFLALWLFRKRARAPLAALLIYSGTLFPALGFLNVFPFRYSFVADHFQYLPSIAVIALFSAGLTMSLKKLPLKSRTAASALMLVLGCALAFLTWNQSLTYVDGETLYRSTILKNPASWMAHLNLGNSLLEGNAGEAMAHIKEAVRLAPGSAEAHLSLGTAFDRTGRPEEAVMEYTKTLRLAPTFAKAHYDLGSVLQQMGRLPEAVTQYEEALRLKPDFAEAHDSLGNALRRSGRLQEALLQHEDAVRLAPGSAEARNNLGIDLDASDRLEEALLQYREAVRLAPGFAQAHNNLGNELHGLGRFEEAAAEYRTTLHLQPGLAATHYNLARTLEKMNRRPEAAAEYEEALRFAPQLAAARTSLDLLRKAH